MGEVHMNVESLLQHAKNAFPPEEGEFSIKGIEDNVEVAWDGNGIPHVTGKQSTDVYFVQGFIHARHRLWQMDLYRRKMSGTLSEIMGEPLIDHDKLARDVGFRYMAKSWEKWLGEQDDGPFKAFLNAYCLGVNAAMQEMGINLPIEFKLLGIKPHAWQIADILLLVYMLDWQESTLNTCLEVFRQYLIDEKGKRVANQVIPLHEGTSFDGSFGSNAWALSPSLTATGKPILCSDPHLAMNFPCLWQLMHLKVEKERPGSMNVIGVSLPGAPGIIIGHNERVGWGITNVQADTQDLFRIRVEPGDPNRYRLDGTWRDMKTRKEVIHVKGTDSPLMHVVRNTEFGPIITHFEKFMKLAPLNLQGEHALRWTGHDVNPMHSLEAFLKINGARTWDEFRHALRLKCTCPHNIIYADKDGNIAHQHAGVIPIRRDSNGATIQDGSKSTNQWASYAGFGNLFSQYNPSRGFVFSANYNETCMHDGVLIAMDRIGFYRQARLESLLSPLKECTVKECTMHQTDCKSYEARDVMHLLLSNTSWDDVQGLTPDLQEILEQWDYLLDVKTIAGCVYKVWCVEVLKLVLRPLLPERKMLLFLEAPPVTIPYMFQHILVDVNDRKKLVTKALENTLDYLKRRLSPNWKKWTWGRLHKLVLAHPFSKVSKEARMLNAGPFKMPGDRNTINNGHCDPTEGYTMIAGPSYRQILDFSAWDESLVALPGGESGLPFHEHYKDLARKHAKGLYIKLPFTKKAIDENCKARWEFNPA
ncbi:hypothetical protein GF325_02280 [Candidatus Bathyarchaeota archaeon]|nr:hypothetical protein [Candidatus Bathyarchaeota archaeon]